MIIENFNIKFLQMGYIILVHRTRQDMIGAAIERQQIASGFTPEHARYTHVVISGGVNRSETKVYIVNIQPPKARLRNLLDAFNGRYIKVMKFKKADVNYARIAYFAATLCDRPYDFLGVLKFRFNILFHRINKWFCSEGSAWAIHMDVPEFCGTIEEYKCMPAHFSASDELETVWEGILPKEV